MNSLGNLTQIQQTMTPGVQFLSLGIFYQEMISVVIECRWIVALIIMSVIVDFYFGRRESKRHYEHSKEQGNKVRMDYFRFHWSRARRRSFNKLVEYLLMLLFGQILGMGFLEPIGIGHIYGAWIGGAYALACELASIVGHIFYLHGIKIEKKTIGGFIKGAAVAFARRKGGEDIGDAVEQGFNEAEKEKEGK